MEYRVKSIFGSYAEQLQVFVDTNLEKFKAPFFSKYFAMGTPQMGLTYATAIGRARIEAAAAVVAHGSEAPLLSRAGLEKLSGEVAAIKIKRKMDEQEYRNWMVFQAMNVSDAAKRDQIISLIWGDVKAVTESVSSRLDIMAAQALSTGSIKLNITTNKTGIIPGTIDLLVTHKIASNDAFAHASTANRLWTAALFASCTPITDIVYFTQNYWQTYGMMFERILMTPDKWWIIQKATEVITVFDGTPTLDNFNSFMQANQLPIIELVNVKANVESDGVASAATTWEDKKYITFVPAGNLGVIHNALSIEQISPVAGVNYAVANNMLISKWSQTEPFGEFTRGEIAAFPGLEVADSMVIINTEHATVF